MNRRTLASVALALTSLSILAAMNACSSAPEESPAGQSSEALLAPTTAPTCTAPFTLTINRCRLELGKLTCAAPECDPVTSAPTPDPGGDTFFTSSTTPPTTVAPPSKLAAAGCTLGIELTAEVDGNPYATTTDAEIWACPESSVPSGPFTREPLCPFNDGNLTTLPLGSLCEADYHGQVINNNSFVGAPVSGWTLVEVVLIPNPSEPGDGGTIHGCEGGCPGANGNGLSSSY